VALMTDHPVIPIQYLSLCAFFACRAGMSEENALKAITINPAEILGIDHRVGSFSEGKDADILILSGSILSMDSVIETVIINGQVVYQDQGEPA
jgi:imidazolonepropionase-like amidohydrolase